MTFTDVYYTQGGSPKVAYGQNNQNNLFKATGGFKAAHCGDNGTNHIEQTKALDNTHVFTKGNSETWLKLLDDDGTWVIGDIGVITRDIDADGGRDLLVNLPSSKAVRFQNCFNPDDTPSEAAKPPRGVIIGGVEHFFDYSDMAAITLTTSPGYTSPNYPTQHDKFYVSEGFQNDDTLRPSVLDPQTPVRYREIGAKGVRFMIPWQNNEGVTDGALNGTYDFTYYDDIISDRQANGLDIIVCLGTNNPHYTTWLASNVYGPIESTQNMDAWVAYAEALMDYLDGKGVSKIQFFNEPNVDRFWKGISMTKFRDFAEYAMPLLRAHKPAFTIHGPGLGGAHSPQHEQYMSLMLSDGVTPLYSLFDSFCVHPYTKPDSPEKMNLHRGGNQPHEMIHNHHRYCGRPGVDLPVLFTETGHSANQEAGVKVSLKEAGDFNGRSFLYSLSLPFDPVHSHFCGVNPDENGSFNGDDGYGILDGEGQPTPTYHVFKEINSRLENGFIGKRFVIAGEPQLYMYEVLDSAKATTSLRVIWHSGGASGYNSQYGVYYSGTPTFFTV